MTIQDVRDHILSLNPNITENLFADHWLSWRIGGKWFALTELDVEEPWISIKLPPQVGAQLRERYNAVRPAYHMNKKHWNDLILHSLPDDFIKEHINQSFNIVFHTLPKATQSLLNNG